ncbi:hypothetical protein B0H19DRAFT_1056213 [Mycena capillaripes]|nr:hypothetical protein B0H19DRAFT_1056213 [Mycena capillaripes]
MPHALLPWLDKNGGALWGAAKSAPAGGIAARPLGGIAQKKKAPFGGQPKAHPLGGIAQKMDSDPKKSAKKEEVRPPRQLATAIGNGDVTDCKRWRRRRRDDEERMVVVVRATVQINSTLLNFNVSSFLFTFWLGFALQPATGFALVASTLAQHYLTYLDRTFDYAVDSCDTFVLPPEINLDVLYCVDSCVPIFQSRLGVINNYLRPDALPCSKACAPAFNANSAENAGP